MLQPGGREHQRVLLGVEAQGGPEEPAEWPDILRLAVGKQGFGGLPIGAAQRAHDVEHHGYRAIPDLVGSLDLRFIDVVAQHRRLAVHCQRWHGAADVKMQITHEAAEGRSHVRRVLHQEAHQSEGGQASLLAEQ